MILILKTRNEIAFLYLFLITKTFIDFVRAKEKDLLLINLELEHISTVFQSNLLTLNFKGRFKGKYTNQYILLLFFQLGTI